jgi:hypothetical protein
MFKLYIISRVKEDIMILSVGLNINHNLHSKMNSIGRVYYINLEHRFDRRENITNWLKKSSCPQQKIERIDAVYIPGRGHIACGLSHIKALETFLSSGEENCIIFEDDFEPLDVPTFWSNFQKVFDAKIPYDVIMCSYNHRAVDYEPGPVDYLIKIRSTFTASGYCITREFAPTVLECLKEAHHLAIEEEELTRCKTHQYMNDVYWCKLMPQSRWYSFHPRIGKQYPNHSDLQGHFVDYGV